MSPTVTTHTIEKSQYEINDDVKVDKETHDYADATFATPHTQDVYAVPHKRKIIRGDDAVTIVDNDIYTENHGYLTPYDADNDITIVDNYIYT